MILLGKLCAILAASLVVAQTTNSTDELALILARRQVDMAAFPTEAAFASIPTWLESQSANGTWSDVDYRLGCDARDATVLAAALKGMDWWFARDYTNPGCTSQGGVAGSTCPCGTPGTWNTNWFGQVILIPQLASTACLLVKDANLTDTQKKVCEAIPRRAYELRDANIKGIGYLTGANAVNVAQNSASLALFIDDPAILADSLNRAWDAVTFTEEPGSDGIHRDGSFLQHKGILYSGNYGKDLLNAFIQLEGEAIGTSFAANETVRTAFATDVRGSEWMIYVDSSTGQEHWDFNVIGRFVAFPRSDLQASSDINFNVTKLAAATADFTGGNNLNDTIERLQSNGTVKLVGNKAFWASDYMVHRRDKYVLANKMLSTRSTNSEYTNSANPYGYHMGQGTLFSYASGTEYADIQASWDWYLVPGTTVLLHAPPLKSSVVAVQGKKDFVGVVSDGWVGASAMDYVDPHDGSLSFRKAWFFLEDSVLVTTTGVGVDRSVPGVSSAPVVSVLDQRAADNTPVVVDGKKVDASSLNVTARTLHYGGNGYLSHGTPFNLTLAKGPRTGNWSAISTSVAGVQTVDLFSAYTTIPETTYSYEFFPATDTKKLASEARHPTTTPIDIGGTLGAAGGGRLALVFWPNSTASVSVPHRTIGWAKKGDIRVATSNPAMVLLSTQESQSKPGKGGKGNKQRSLVVNIVDPTQALASLTVTISSSAGATISCGKATACRNVKGGVALDWTKGSDAFHLGFTG